MRATEVWRWIGTLGRRFESDRPPLSWIKTPAGSGLCCGAAGPRPLVDRAAGGRSDGQRIGARRLRRLRDDSGGVAVIAAIAVPALAMFVAAGVELTFLVRDRGQMQDAADSAVLQAARELTLTSGDSASERARSFAASALTSLAARSELTITAAALSGPPAIKIDITDHRLSFFGNLLPPGGFTIHVTSTAEALNTAPLCVLAHGEGSSAEKKKGKGLPPAANPGDAIIQMDGPSRLQAPSCLVHSNASISVKSPAALQALRVQVVNGAAGVIQPAADVGAVEIEDPFASYDLNAPAACAGAKTPKVKLTGSEVLAPGVHCGDITLAGDAEVSLAPGEHYFVGHLTADANAKLTGDDVVLIFDDQSKFDFKGNATVSLRGRRAGPLAGFVVIASRANNTDFQIASDHVTELLGTLYVPGARLVIDGEDKVAQASAWTVVVAYSIRVSNAASLVVNANYGASPVPVPTGVGPNRASSRLVK